MKREIIAGAIAELMADADLSLTDISEAIRERTEAWRIRTEKSSEHSPNANSTN
jgi:hypothetical protein